MNRISAMMKKNFLAFTILFIWQCNCIKFKPFAKESVSNKYLNCGRAKFNPLVEHSTKASNSAFSMQGTYPWMVLIRNSKDFCAGVMLPSTMGNMSVSALSTVSCLLQLSETDLTTIKLIAGAENVPDNSETSRQEVNIMDMIRISESKDGSLGLMLLALSKPIVFNDYVRPICLPNGESVLPGDKCVFQFWNRLFLDQPLVKMQRKILPQEVSLTIVEKDNCKASKLFDSTKFVCIKKEQTVDLFEMDISAGGPLICKYDEYWTLHGLAGPTYAGTWKPTGFIRISHYKNKLTEKLNLSAKK